MQSLPENILLTNLFHKPIYAVQELAKVQLLNLEGEAVENPLLLLVLKYSAEQSISDSDILLQKKFVHWLGLDAGLAACYPIQEEPLSFVQLLKYHRIGSIICYGAVPADLGLKLEYQLNEPIQFLNCRMLFTHSFVTVQQNEKIKKEFFNVAARLFSDLKTIHP